MNLKHQYLIPILAAAIAALIGLIPFLITIWEDSQIDDPVTIVKLSIRAEGYQSSLERKIGDTTEINVKSEYGKDNGVTKTGTVTAPDGWKIASFKQEVKKTLGERKPSVSLSRDDNKINYSIYVEHGPWWDKWRSWATLKITPTYIREGQVPWVSNEIFAFEQRRMNADPVEFSLENTSFLPPEQATLEKYILNVHLKSDGGSLFWKAIEFKNDLDYQQFDALGLTFMKDKKIIRVKKSNN